MGCDAEECRAYEIVVEDSNYDKYGCKYPGNPKYDKRYWKDAIGVIRKVSDMDNMHICFVLLQCLNGKGRFWKERKEVFLQELSNRKYFTYEIYRFHLQGIKLGLYCMYPDEEETYLLENYYMRMCNDYRFDDSKLIEILLK